MIFVCGSLLCENGYQSPCRWLWGDGIYIFVSVLFNFYENLSPSIKN